MTLSSSQLLFPDLIALHLIPLPCPHDAVPELKANVRGETLLLCNGVLLPPPPALLRYSWHITLSKIKVYM